MLGGKPASQVRAQFRYHGLEGDEVDAVNAQRIHAAYAGQLCAQVEAPRRIPLCFLRGLFLLPLRTGGRRRNWARTGSWRCPGRQHGQIRLKLAVAFGNLPEPEIVFIDGMPEFEQLILLPVSFQRSRYLLCSKNGLDRDAFEELMGAMARSGLVRLVDSVFEKDGKTIPFRKASLTRDAEYVN